MGKFEKTSRPRQKAPVQAQRYAQERSAAVGQPKKKKRKKNVLPLVLGIVGALAVISACVAGYFLFRDDGRIADDVYVAGVNIGDLTREEALAALEQVSLSQNMNIRLYTKGDSFTIYTTTYDPAAHPATDIYGNVLENAQTSPEPEPEAPVTDENAPVDEYGVPYVLDKTLCLPAEAVNAALDMEAAVEEAYLIGRETKATPDENGRIDLDVSNYLTLNETYIREVLVSTLEDTTTIGTETYIEKGTTTITDRDGNPKTVDALEIDIGTVTRDLNVTALYNEILNAYIRGQYDLQYIYEETVPAAIDLDELYAEYGCYEPVNAVCDPETYDITDGKNGYGFRMKDAVNAFAAAKPGETVVLTLCELEPDFTSASLEKELFCDVLSSYSSKHSTYNSARTENLRLACKAINGTIVGPGETFSFNDIVGERTEAKGYGYANAYIGGRDTPSLGGGICQVASVLFWCTIKADLEVIERWEHMYAPEYIPWGMDATIYWGSLDYKWRNNTTHPIRIDANVANGYVNISFVGTETKDYTVELEYVTTSYYEVEDKIIDIYPGMANYSDYKKYDEGDVIQTAYPAANVTTYRYKYDRDGNLIDKEVVCYSKYEARAREIAHIRDDDEDEPDDPTEPPTTTAPPTTTQPPTTTAPPTTEPPTTEAPTTQAPTDPPEDSGDGGD